jgi:hypothetical protein
MKFWLENFTGVQTPAEQANMSEILTILNLEVVCVVSAMHINRER